MKNNKIVVALIVIGIIAISLFIGYKTSLRFGGVTNYDELDATAIKIGGSNGSRIGPIISTTCTLSANFAITATTTRLVPCAVTGVVSGDTVIVELQATTSTASTKYRKVGATASSTSGYIDVALFNNNEDGLGNTTPTATNGFGSSTQVLIIHPVSSIPGL